MAPSTFASAAAGTNQGPNSAREGAAEWSRRPNGSTQTFRRPSAASMSTSNTHSEANALANSQAPPRYVPPHRNGTTSDSRYGKDQLLDFFKAQQSAEGGLNNELQELYVSGWQPDSANGPGGSSWGRGDHNRDVQPGPEVCWDKDGSMEPLGLIDMDDDERELFATSVNTPMKPPASNKENQQSNGLPGRKISISGQGGASGSYGLASPTATRGGRRRDTSESYPFPSTLVSPTATFDRNEQRVASPPPSLQRRRTDIRDGTKGDRNGESEDKAATTPFGSLKRHPTGPLSAGLGAPPSPWSNAPQSAGLSPMGSFGNFGLGQAQGDKKAGLGSGRAESRFKDLLSKDSSEDTGLRFGERKSSMSGSSRFAAGDSWRTQDISSLPLEETDEELASGSAALTADADISTPSRPQRRDDLGFGAFGMTSDAAHGFGSGFTQQTPGQQRHLGGGNEPMSPTDTNPYQSPEQRGIDNAVQEMEGPNQDLYQGQLPGLGGYAADQSQLLGSLGGLGALPNLGRQGGPGPASDRSQTSSVGANRGYPGLSGLGQLSGVSGAAAWPSTHGGLGTPTRSTAGLSNAFGGGMFTSGMSDLQSPSLAGLGGGPGMLGQQTGIGGSRMASMFPPSMQEQMRQNEQERDSGVDRASYQQFMGQLDQPHSVDQTFGDPATTHSERDLATEQEGVQFGAPGQGTSLPPPSAHNQQIPQPPSSASNQPPPPQQRTMVMPDRMRWIYRDPQGQTQGPWSGLEMHDWYKAGFFSPELLVKKYEDPDYEPLAQLIRRIGNSREPFLVPQIGIPHGPPSSNGPTSWAGNQGVVPPPSAGGTQPPFANSFPSFGTTLTAEQQNALERRKQEEQYLMARQKEHLAQQQMAQRMQLGMTPAATGSHGGLLPSGQLQHHASTQSLHSQPSFGSMTSPNAGPFQPSPLQAPQPGFFDNSFRSPAAGGLGAVGAGVDSLGHIREEEIPGIADRLNEGNRAAPGQFGAPGQHLTSQLQQHPLNGQDHDAQIEQMLQDRARLQQEQALHDAQQQGASNEPFATGERMAQFQQLQNQSIDARFQPAMGKLTMSDDLSSAMQSSIGSPSGLQIEQTPPQELSLTEQVQKAASVQQSPVQPQSGLPQPFPPAPSQSPLPAPAAQRAGRQSVADQLQTEQRETSNSPSVETPSAAIAPWAKEPAEALKGPSLREIQEMEARQAAEADQVAAAARRALFQKEMEAQAQAQAAIPPAPGLPATASWAAGSPLTPTGTSSAWAKAAQKPSSTATAKSMAQIQKEEEARKRKLAAAAVIAQAAVVGVVPSPSGGKSYANLAGKVSVPTASGGSVWTTVGAGGKPKTPSVPAPPATARTVSSGLVSSAQPAVKKLPSRSATMASPGSINAQEEFRKWAVGELRPDLNKGISAEEFTSNLIALPPDADMLTEAVHGASNTIDSRHFAEEFIRRKRLADKGLVDTSAPQKTASPLNAPAGGWSEVAKKGPAKEAPKEESNGHFRVVAAKKKGSKR